MILINGGARRGPPSVAGGGGGAAGFTPETDFTLSGTISDGETLTITDAQSRFGTKPNGAKALYVFDWGDSGVEAANTSYSRNTYDSFTSDLAITQSTTAPHASNSLEYIFTGGTQGIPNPGLSVNPASSPGQLYSYRRWKSNFTASQAYANDTGWNLKWLFWFTNGTSQSDPFMPLQGGQHQDHLNQRFRWDPDTEPGGGTTHYFGGSTTNLFGNTDWRIEEVMLQQSSGAGVADAEFHAAWEGDLYSFTGEVSHDAGSYPYDEVEMVRAQGGWADTSWRIFYDIWYLDDSWCRVQIVSGSTWSDTSQNTEIQYPMAWAADEVQFVFRDGMFGGSLSGKTLFVTKDDGTHLKIGTFD